MASTTRRLDKICDSSEQQQPVAPAGPPPVGQASGAASRGRLKCDSFKLIDATGPELAELQQQQQVWASQTSLLTLKKRPPPPPQVTTATSEPQQQQQQHRDLLGSSIFSITRSSSPGTGNNYAKTISNELPLNHQPVIEQNNNTIPAKATAAIASPVMEQHRKQSATASSPIGGGQLARDQVAAKQQNVNGGGDPSASTKQLEPTSKMSTIASYTQQQQQQQLASTSITSYTSLFDCKKPQQPARNPSPPGHRQDCDAKPTSQFQTMMNQSGRLQKFRGPPLQKQAAADLQSGSSASLRRPAGGPGQTAASACKRSDYDIESASYTNSHLDELEDVDDEDDDINTNEDEDDDDDDDDDVDEKAPFNSIDKQRLSLASSRLQQQQQQTSSNNKTSRLIANDAGRHLYPGSASRLQQPQKSGKTTLGRTSESSSRKQRSGSPVLLNGTKAARHTKISLNSMSRPPSFNACQLERGADNKKLPAGECRKLDLLEQVACLDCDCSHCLKKHHPHHKSPPIVSTINDGHALAYHIGKCAPDSGYYHGGGHIEARYPKTRIAHMILKSIILLLCTLLLLLVLFGAIMMSLHLPRAFDQVLNVSRSFNVTIAGRR